MKKSIWVLRALSRKGVKSTEISALKEFKQKYMQAKNYYDHCESIYAMPILQEMMDESAKLNISELSDDFIELIARSKYLFACVKWRKTTCQQDDYEATQLLEEALKLKPDFEGADKAIQLKDSIIMENYFFEDFKPSVSNKQ